MIIFWDIDGTLMHCGSDGTTALNEAFHELYGLNDAFHQVGIGSAMDSAILETIMEKFNIPTSDLDIIKKKFNERLEHILDENYEKCVLPGIRELLYFAKREGHINSLLTSNMKSGAYIKLKSVDLDNHFIGGGFGDEKGEKWDIALQAQREIEESTGSTFSPDSVVLIGDSVYDINTARRLGYNMISVATGWTPEGVLRDNDPDVLFDSFRDADAVMDVIRMMDNGRTE